jgi:hypothetical protein
MHPSVRSALTLAVLCLLLAVGAAWGWSALTQPLPNDEPPPLCVDTPVPAGTQVFRDQVVVSVFNGSRRAGLAGATMEQLQDRGFVGADTGNAPVQVPGVQIWSADPQDPAVKLVKRQFPDAEVVAGDALGRGVVVVVGESFAGLGKDVEAVTAKADATICSPPDGG